MFISRKNHKKHIFVRRSGRHTPTPPRATKEVEIGVAAGAEGDAENQTAYNFAHPDWHRATRIPACLNCVYSRQKVI